MYLLSRRDPALVLADASSSEALRCFVFRLQAGVDAFVGGKRRVRVFQKSCPVMPSWVILWTPVKGRLVFALACEGSQHNQGNADTNEEAGDRGVDVGNNVGVAVEPLGVELF